MRRRDLVRQIARAVVLVVCVILLMLLIDNNVR
jgi:hypothetical protein